MKERVLVVGMDCAEFSVIDDRIAKGKLPNLASIMGRGVRANLMSTPYYYTPPAWTTMLSGVNPGRHGALGFTTIDGYDFGIFDSRSIKAKRLWHYLGARGLRSLVVNVPLTYPPEPIDGWMVTGMLTPDQSVSFTYPEALKDEILEEFPTFEPEARRKVKGEELHGAYVESSRLKGRVYDRLLDRYDWDLAFMVFTEPDKVQHNLWPDMDRIGDVYEEIDAFIGRAVDRFGDDTHVMVVSDHGSGPYRCTISVNRWLSDHGYLRMERPMWWQCYVKRPFKNWVGRVLRKATPGLHGRLVAFLERGSEEGGDKKRGWDELVEHGSGALSAVRLGRTKAFGMECGVRINLRGREPEGIVEPADCEDLVASICHEMRKLMYEGEPVIEDAVPTRQLYDGPHVEGAADIMVILPGTPGFALPADGPVIEPKDLIPGSHRRPGILLYRHPSMELGIGVPDMDIGEVAPMVLYLLGLPVPEGMEHGVREWLKATCGGREPEASDEPVELSRGFDRATASAISRLRSGLGDDVPAA